MNDSILIQIILTGWNIQNKHLAQLLAELSDDQLLQPIAPGKNTGRYLLGHLTAIADYLLPLLGIGERLYAPLETHYIRTPDNPEAEQPTVAELKEMYKQVIQRLDRGFAKFTPEDWLDRHMNISPEDFAKEPHRNKINVVLNRTHHTAYHLGQMIWLKKT